MTLSIFQCKKRITKIEKLSNPADSKTSCTKQQVTNFDHEIRFAIQIFYILNFHIFTRAFSTQSESYIHALSKAVYPNCFFLYISLLDSMTFS